MNEPNDGEVDIEIPDNLLIKKFFDPIVTIISSTYPSLLENYSNPNYLKEIAILAPTLDIVDRINQYILALIPVEEKVSLS